MYKKISQFLQVIIGLISVKFLVPSYFTTNENKLQTFNSHL
jgi:hypothetical protein